MIEGRETEGTGPKRERENGGDACAPPGEVEVGSEAIDFPPRVKEFCQTKTEIASPQSAEHRHRD